MRRRTELVSAAAGSRGALHHAPKRSSNRVLGLVFALAFVIAAAVFPSSLSLLNRVWARFGILPGNMVSPLAPVYYVTVVPVPLLMRLLGKDPRRLRFDKNAASYWLIRDPKARPDASMRYQFLRASRNVIPERVLGVFWGPQKSTG